MFSSLHTCISHLIRLNTKFSMMTLTSFSINFTNTKVKCDSTFFYDFNNFPFSPCCAPPFSTLIVNENENVCVVVSARKKGRLLIHNVSTYCHVSC